MTDRFGHRWTVGAAAGPMIAAVLAGSAAYAVEQDSFHPVSSALDQPTAQAPKKDKALLSLQHAVSQQQRHLDQMRADLRQAEHAISRTKQETQAVLRGAQSTYVPSVSVSSGGGYSGSSSVSSSSGGSTATSSAPTTHTTTGASSATPP